ncbi:MAG TPA: type II toxin-antitoxin system PemK/MazF family toxin [Gammaproteobacteria bacterium]|jgi:mRNA interferase MazF|nr:type II toxin-antitoxin system PemK/MazF family toxin [Gammaproteobacteria bacterium]
MVGQREILTRGGIYLAKLSSAKAAEVEKVRPIVILNAQEILDILPPVIFICPLSSQSYPAFNSLHVKLSPRDNLKAISYALVEHCRAISINRMTYPRIAQLTHAELLIILHRLQQLVDG